VYIASFKIAAAVAIYFLFTEPVQCSAAASTKQQWTAEPSESFTLEQLSTALTTDDARKAFLGNGDIPSTEAALNLLNTIVSDDAPTGAAILHIVKWRDKNHTSIQFERWYLYDYDTKGNAFYLEKNAAVLDRTCIPGRRHLTIVYLCLRNDADRKSPLQDADSDMDALKRPALHSIVMTKQQTQFVQDAILLTQMLGITMPPAMQTKAPPPPPRVLGLSAQYAFDDPYAVSSVAINSTLPSPDGAKSTAVESSVTYVNEGPTWIGLSAAMPVTSYKDVVFQSSSDAVVPKTVTRQDAYITVDFYMPPVEAALIPLRWLPHPFVGLPLGGKVLEHPMVGVGINLKYVELFYGVVGDFENRSPTGNRHTVWKGVFGLKLSVSAAKTMLGKN
jgi:hypothetical protein